MLNRRQQRFFDAYIASGSATRAAQESGIAVSTAYKYLRDPEFNAELSRYRVAELRKSTVYLQNKLQLCSETLIEIIESDKTSAAVKIQAVQAVYGSVERAIDRIDILDRLDALERRDS